MAKNFRVCAKETGKQSLALQLFGDFDATSACELIHLLTESIKTNAKVAIDTDGLKTINAFGLAVFLPRMSRLDKKRTDIEVTGRYSQAFMEM
jgi:stage II sporulation protein AA (anti-sigma F factor antagonist)